jgi:hypothetical protein
MGEPVMNGVSSYDSESGERMSIFGRVALAVVGVIVVFVGFVAWSLEDEYGSGLNFSLSSRAGGPWIVSEVDGQNGTSVVRFEGSQEDATAYMEERRSAGENFLIPGLVIVGGAILIVVAIFWPHFSRFRSRGGADA